MFFGTDYHSHLGTRRGGLAFYDEKKGLYLGRDEFGRMGYFQSDKNVVGEFVNLKVTKANGISLFGELVE